MKQGNIYKSEGGYRVAWAIWDGEPVITNSPWYATEKEAEQAKIKRKFENDKQDAIDKAIKDGDFSSLENLDPKTAKAIKEG